MKGRSVGRVDLFKILFGDQRLSVCFDVSGKRHLITDCRFLCGQKAAEKPAPSSEAGGTAWGLHAPKSPKEEVEGGFS